MKKIKPVSPGEMLEEEFLKPYGLTKYRLAKEIGVPPQRIGDIVAGKRAITADTDLRLCRYFGLSDGWWLRGQMEYDMAMTKAGKTFGKRSGVARRPSMRSISVVPGKSNNCVAVNNRLARGKVP